jgi:hypothetical protein
MPDLSVTVNGTTLAADWVDDHPDVRAAVEEALPLSGEATRWGEELYFRTNVDVDVDGGRREVPVGAVAYWPEGNAICLFWGPTPASENGQPVAASPVAVVARLWDVRPLHRLSGGARVVLE